MSRGGSSLADVSDFRLLLRDILLNFCVITVKKRLCSPIYQLTNDLCSTFSKPVQLLNDLTGVMHSKDKKLE